MLSENRPAPKGMLFAHDRRPGGLVHQPGTRALDRRVPRAPLQLALLGAYDRSRRMSLEFGCPVRVVQSTIRVARFRST